MTRLWSLLRSCAPIAQGMIGALVILALYLAGAWTWTRYQEFLVMRQVVGQILQQQQQQQAQTHQAPAAK